MPAELPSIVEGYLGEVLYHELQAFSQSVGHGEGEELKRECEGMCNGSVGSGSGGLGWRRCW